MQITINVPNVIQGIGKVVTVPFVVLFRGLLGLFGILAVTVVLTSAVLPLLTLVTLSAGNGDDVLNNTGFWLVLGLSFAPIIIVFGIASMAKGKNIPFLK